MTSLSSKSSKPSDADFIFHYDRILGEGSFSAVLLATEKRTGKKWAVKTMELAELQRNKMQDYAYRERNALNLLKERPWSPSHLLSSLTESNSKTRCNSIAEEDEEKVVNEKTTLCKLASSVIEDEDEEDDKSKIITEETGDVVVNDNEDAAQNALLKEQRQLQHQQRKQFLRLQQQQRRGQVSSSGQKKSTQMRNPFFVELHSSFASAGHFFLVLSHALNGDLLQCLKSRGSFSVPVARFYLAEIVSAVHHLHSIGIIHRDLKPENILLGPDMHILIADFGSCKILHHSPSDQHQQQQNNQQLNQHQQQHQQQLQRPSRASISPTRCVPNLPSPVGSETGSTGSTGSTGTSSLRRKSSVGSGDSRTIRPRVASFVGTAQYVSPEMIKGRPEEKASDLWALGCILYHFLAGEFPFVGANDHRVFQKIQALDFQFPTTFDSVAKDLVRKLIVLDPAFRLGSGGCGGFASLIRHPFFHTIDWETLHLQTPPLRPPEDLKDLSMPIVNEQSSPGFSKNSLISASLKLEEDDEDDEEAFELVTSKRRKSSASRPASQPQPVPTAGGKIINDDLSASSPSPDAKSLTPTAFPSSPASSSSGSSSLPKRTPPTTGAWTASSTVPLILEMLDLSLEEKRRKREKQMKENVYHRLVEGNLILKCGILEKKRHAHYPTRKRMFLLTEGPHLFYVDPDKKQLKGKVPWSPTMSTKYLSFKKFEIKTPNRTYDLLDPTGGAIDWCQCLDAVKEKFFSGVT